MMLSAAGGTWMSPGHASPKPAPVTGALALLGSVAVHAALLLAPSASHRSPDPPAPVGTIVQVHLVAQTSAPAGDQAAARVKVAAGVAPRLAAERVQTRAAQIEREMQAPLTEGGVAASDFASESLASPLSKERENIVVAAVAPREARPASTPVAFLHAPEPDYPQSAREESEEGLVVLRVRVSREGRPLEIRIVASSGVRALDAAAVAGVGRWIFTPARNGAEAIESWMDVPIRFRLK